MPRREDIVSCIDVTIMDRSAHSALPSSYSKIFPAFWSGALALEHFDRQFVAVIDHRADLARQAAQPRRLLVLHPQAQDPDSRRSLTGHPYSIPKSPPMTLRQTSRNASRGTHAALRVSLSLASLKASVSPGEIG